MKNSTGCVVMITGADNGIGLHMTATLLKDGYRVAAMDIDGQNLFALQADFPDSLLYLTCDVTDEKAVRDTVKKVWEKWERIDVLVNNACIAVFEPFEDRDINDIRREFEINYFGYLNMIKNVLPHMKRQGKGIIHNMSSGVGITGFPGICGYSSTKGAIEALTRTLDLELSDVGVRVNLMHPPLTDTKSARPLGIPKEMMSTASKVGDRLAKKIMSTRAVITPDFQTSLGLFMSSKFPNAVGKLLSKASRKANTDQNRRDVSQ